MIKDTPSDLLAMSENVLPQPYMPFYLEEGQFWQLREARLRDLAQDNAAPPRSAPVARQR